jgi:hypothetical protein
MAAELGLNVKLAKSWTITRYWKVPDAESDLPRIIRYAMG